MVRGAWLIPCCLLCSGAARAVPVEVLSAFARAGGAVAIAASPSGRVVVGDERGAWSSRGGSAAQRFATGTAVRDALFTRDGALWLATDDGLRREDPISGRLTLRGPGLGAARRVRDLLPAGEGVLAATAAGLFHVTAREARPLGSAAPRGDATALAWSRADPPRWLAALVDERVHRVHLGSGFLTDRVERIVLPPGAGSPLDLAPADAGVWILTEHALYRAGDHQVERAPHSFPAGAEPLRIVAASGQLWLATDRGLYRDATDGWQPVGATGVPIAAISASAGFLWAAGARGVWRVALGSAPTGGGPTSALRAASSAPEISQLHRVVARAHGLDPARGRRWRERVARRGRLPELELRFGYGGSHDRSGDYDEAYSSGAVRRLHDRDWDRSRDFDVQAVLRWDWGDALHHPEEVDVAKEVREWIELRDEILDEVDQLYFERLRVLAERDALGADDPARIRLEIRAAELSAGLDAWTDGWWGPAMRAAADPPRSPPPGPAENQP